MHETDTVSQLLVQNKGAEDVFIQAGDIVKGGKQDRVVTASFVLPAKSKETAVPVYCVEAGRWAPRGNEDSRKFSASAEMLPTKEAKLAMLAAERGYHMILVMPETVSIERRKLAASYGAKIELTSGSEGMKGAVKRAEELRQSIPGAIVAGQFTNPANPRAHYQTTGPEIWRDTEGTVTAVVAGVGTGGTISGTSKFLKEQNPAVRGIAVEPAESQVLAGKPAGPHRIQGIGAGFIPKTYDASVVDEVVPVTSDDAIATKKRLAESGLLVGISSGAAVAAALQLADRPEYEGGTIVAILPDTGERYLSMDL